jgi:H+/Cl- antiporter ClcA
MKHTSEGTGSSIMGGFGNGGSPTAASDHQERRVISNRRLIGWAAVVGGVGGLLALVYYFLLKGLMYLVWNRWAGFDWLEIPPTPGFHAPVLVITTVGGLFVGLALKYLGTPGEIAAVVDNIHLEEGRIDVKQTPSMFFVSLISIAAGGSAGPEAPLVQMIGSFGSWIGDRLRLRGDLVRTLTFSGMATALGAFFGAPLGGALFALEIPHRRSVEYYEALVPSILASIVGFLIFRGVLGYEGAIYHLPVIEHLSFGFLLWAAGLGIFGGAIAWIFVGIFHFTEFFTHPFSRHPVLLATLGGAALGILAQFAPKVLFWGEFQIDYVINAGPELLATYGLRMAVILLFGLAFAKMLAIGFTLHSGFRGGFIFPLFFIGAAAGIAMSLLIPGLPVAVSAICMMAAVNVAVTKTPISTSVILTTLSGTSMMPVVLVASFASYFLTTRVTLIGTQRPRRVPQGDWV